MKKYLGVNILLSIMFSLLVMNSSIIFAAVNPTGSNYTNNSTNRDFTTAGKTNAESVLQKDSKGNYTEASIRAYQAATPGLKVDGMIGIETATALNKATTSSITATEGRSTDTTLSEAETEKALQEASDLAKDTRTDAERDAADQEALKNATTPKVNTSTTDNILGIDDSKLKAGDVDMNTIPLVIVNIISTLLAIAGTIAIFSLIYHAVKMQINSGITGDSSGVDSAKKGMIGALIGFVIAISAWFLVTQAVTLLGNVT